MVEMFFRLRRYAERGWGYYKLYGLRRFIWALGFKFRQFWQHSILSGAPSHLANNAAHGSAILNSALTRDDGSKVPAWFRSNPNVATVPTRPAKAVLRQPLIAIIGDLGLPQCKKYRVLQKMEAFTALNIESDYAHYEDIYRSLNLIQIATTVIFYRTRATPAFELLVEECRRLGVPFLYDIDDPIFSAEIYAKNVNLDHLSDMERKILLNSSGEYVAAMKRCSNFIASTPRMVEEIEKLGLGKANLWRNAIDAETEQAVSLAFSRKGSETRADSKNVRIVYASGSRAHEADFRTIEPVLLDLLERHLNLEFHVIGYLSLPKTFAPFNTRIFQSDFAGYPEYISKLATCDIAVVPLVIDDFNDCKSAIRFMEAALAGTPCIAASVGDFKNIVSDRIDGRLACTESEWMEALESLILNPDLRSNYSEAASRNVRAALGVEAIAEALPLSLKDIFYARQ